VSEKREKARGGRSGDFFSVGQPLNPLRGGYVRRRADDELYDIVVSGRYAHVIAPRNSGKSSLVAATAARLRNHGYKVATLDLSQIAERDGGSDAGRWYYSIAYRLLRQLRLKIDLQDWWQDKSMLSNRQRLVEFYTEVVLQNVREPVVVFVDEIQNVERLPFKEHLLPSIRSAHNARITDPEFERLGFVLCGESDIESLVDDPALSPFRVSKAVGLEDFTRPELDLFATELNLPAPEARVALDRIWYWTGGQPYLCQKLCRALSRDPRPDDVEGQVDRLVGKLLAGRAALHSEPHMQHLHRRIVRDRKDSEAMLNLYGRLRKGLDVAWDPDSRPLRKLVAAGLVRVTDTGLTEPRNRVYAAVFTARWANQYLPVHWRGPAIAAVALLALVALPFWYTQLLPKPYTRILVSPETALPAAESAWRNLRSFPGHGATADRLYRTLLEQRAERAASQEAIGEVGDYARALPGEADFAERLSAGYWDREVRRASRREARDDALIAALEALVLPTPERRRVAAALVGDDYPRLVASLPPTAGERLLFNARDLVLSRADGPRMAQWVLRDSRLVAREPWTVSALEVTPLVRRVAVDRPGSVSRIGLSVNVSHSRLDDLRLKLIAPSGRTAELTFDGGRSSASESTAFGRELLSTLVGEPLSGTWSLTLRDEATGVNGHLVGWSLSLNSQVLVEDFERGLDIPAPVERDSDNLWFSPDGRFAVARAMQSDSARMWDLTSGRPARTIAVPADERVLGVSAEGRYLVTLAQDDIHLWRTVNGRREAVLSAGAAGAEIALTPDRQRLWVLGRGEPESRFALWSLDERRRLADLALAGTPALVATDATGDRLAVADYDRSVRLWNTATGELLAQLDLPAQPGSLRLSPDGQALALAYGEQGMSLWSVAAAAEPLLVERSRGRWHVAFSPDAETLLAGSGDSGFRTYRTSDGSLAGPAWYPGLAPGADAMLDYSSDRQLALTVAPGAGARLWRAEPAGDTADDGSNPGGYRVLQGASDAAAAISPGGRFVAAGDREGHVHLLAADGTDLSAATVDELAYFGHQGPVTHLAFSPDAGLVGSTGADGAIRVWDAATGKPRPFGPELARGPVHAFEFSPRGNRLAILSGQRAAMIDTASGAVLADLDPGGAHRAIAFGADGLLYLGSETGELKRLARDPIGGWQLRTVWQGDTALRSLAASPTRPLLAVATADRRIRLFDLRDGRVGEAVLELPSDIEALQFTPSETRLLARTGGWVHRASVSRSGLVWIDAIRAPRPLAGSGIAVARVDTAEPGGDTLAAHGDELLVLTNDPGRVEIARIGFVHDEGPLLFGDRDALLEDWRRRLGRSTAPP